MPYASSDSSALETRSPTTSIRLRPATFDDYDQIVAVQAANGLSTKPRDQWLHVWQNNPAYQQLADWPVGWVLEDQRRRIVGALENVPCLFRMRRRTYVGAFGRGWAVDPAYRGHAFALYLHHWRQANVDLFLTNTANPRTAALLTNRGWSRVPVGRWDQSAFWVASYTQTAKRFLDRRAPHFVSALAGPLLNLRFRRNDFNSAHRHHSARGYELRWDTHFDAQFDEFWNELQERNPDRLLSVRTSPTLLWHFRYALDQKRAWLLTASDGSKLIGYAIFERRQVQSVDLARLILVDLQTLGNNPGLVAAMIGFAIERCREDRVQIIENIGCWLGTQRQLVNRHQFRRNLESWSYLYNVKNRELARILTSPEAWYPTQYDADASL